VALKGTLDDFGIAEILQLIGQQAKSGVLHLESGSDQVHITMAEGAVVRAEAAGRKVYEKLGNRLVRAGVMDQAALEHALEIQKRTLRRLGDILVEAGSVSAADLKEMTALQTTETVYKLFTWKSGTYEFEPGEVEWDPAQVTPLRAESVLMEGFRQIDEWPLVRKRIPSMAATFERLRPLEPEAPATVGAGTGDLDAALDGLGGDGDGDGVSGRADLALGRNERRVYALAEPGRSVDRMIELSRLGEFETSKALLNLVNLGFLKVASTDRPRAPAPRGPRWGAKVKTALVRAGSTLLLAAALAGLLAWLDQAGLLWGDRRGRPVVRDNALQRLASRSQLDRLRGALEVYRLERGSYPDRLEALLEVGLAAPRDLHYPWNQTYHYRRDPEGRYLLLPPVE
jgi:hypothetical protein